MQTKFILHGGASSRDSKENQKFFLEVLNSVDKKEIKILCVYFARPFHRWEESFYEDKEIFLSQGSEKKLEIEIATRNEFKAQITKSDIIFINGGMRDCLKEELMKLGDIKNFLRGKVIVGISAGANMMSKYYFSSVTQSIRKGLGILPIKIFTHYDENEDKNYQALLNHEDKFKTFKIEEEKFLIFDV